MNKRLNTAALMASLAFAGLVGLVIHGPIGSHLVMTPSPVEITALSSPSTTAKWSWGLAYVTNEPGLWTSGSIAIKGTPTLDPAPAGQVQDFTILLSTCQDGHSVAPDYSCQVWLSYNPVPNGITKTLLRVTEGDGTVLTDVVEAITMQIPKGFPNPVFPNP